jgi:hypothetical protein
MNMHPWDPGHLMESCQPLLSNKEFDLTRYRSLYSFEKGKEIFVPELGTT